MNYKQYLCTMVSILIVLTALGCTNKTNDAETGRPGASKSGLHKLLTVTENYANSMKEGSGQPMQVHHSAVIAQNGSGVAYMDVSPGGSGQVIHNGIVGKYHRLVGDVAISPDGSKVAYMAQDDERFKRIIMTGAEGPPFMELGDPQFTPDSKHLLYAVSERDAYVEKQHNYLVVDHRVKYEIDMDQNFTVSSDSRWIAMRNNPAFNETPVLTITDLSMKDRVSFPGCGDSHTANSDKTLLAVVCREAGKSHIKVIDFRNRSVVSSTKPRAVGGIIRVKFAADNRSVAYTFIDPDDPGKRFIAFNDQAEIIPSGYDIATDPLQLSGNITAAAISNINSARLYKAFTGTQKEGNTYAFISDLVGSADLRHYAYLAGNPKVNGYQLVVDGIEGPVYDMIVAPFFTPDSKYVVCRVRKNGKRFVVVVDLNGKVVAKHKEYEMVFQPTVSKDGKSLEYAVLDGKDFWWIVDKIK